MVRYAGVGAGWAILVCQVIADQAAAQSIVVASSTVAASAAGATSAAAASAAVTSSTSATVAATTATSATPSLVFGSIPTLDSCGTFRVTWNLANEEPTDFNITLRVVQASTTSSITSTSVPPAAAATHSSASAVVGASISAVAASVSAAASPSPAVSSATAVVSHSSTAVAASASSTAAAHVRDFRYAQRADAASTTPTDIDAYAAVDEVIVSQSASVGYTWSSIPLAAGSYYIVGTINDTAKTTAQSAVFAVVDAGNSTCLSAATGSSSTTSASHSPASGSAASLSPASSSSANDTGSGSETSHSLGGGAIAGVVVGAIAAISAAIAVLWFLRRRRRSQRPTISDPQMAQRRSHSHLGFRGVSSEGSRSHDMHSGGPIVPISPLSPMSLEGRGSEESDHKAAGAAGMAGGIAFAPHEAGSVETLPDEVAVLDSGYGTGSGPGNTSGQRNPFASQPPTPRADSNDEFSQQQQPRRPSASNSPGSTTNPVMVRQGSIKRKPVPSLGPELRRQMQGDTAPPVGQQDAGRGASAEVGRRTSYQLVPDLPSPQED